jgi:hypothetical protein
MIEYRLSRVLNKKWEEFFVKALITAALVLIATPCLTQQSIAQQSVP